MGKEKKEKRKSESGEGEDKESHWAERLNHVTPIANPLASRKLAKKLYKCMKKAFNEKMLRKGVKEVQRFLRKGERGIIVLAGDINPIDVICHMPLVCEEKDIPYCYTPSKEDLGAALGSKRPSTMVLIKEHDEYKSLYNELYEEIQDSNNADVLLDSGLKLSDIGFVVTNAYQLICLDGKYGLSRLEEMDV